MHISFIPVIFSLAACAEHIHIEWNISTDVGHSKRERLYEYPMFTEIAPSPCDLIDGVCDTGCCSDPDCDSQQKGTFNCSAGTAECTRPYSKYDCSCPFDRPFWFSALCYVFENPIYLGLFYKTLAKIEDLKSFVAQKNPRDYKYGTSDKLNGDKQYRFGSTVLSYASQNGSLTPVRHALLHEMNPPPGHSCQAPVKYMQHSQHSCYVRITKEDCESIFVLGARSYLLRSENYSPTQDIPVILKNLETDESAKFDINVKYSSSENVVKQRRGRFYRYYFTRGDLRETDNNPDLFNTFSNGTHCLNVVARVVFNFITNASEILNVNAQFVLTNVSIAREKSESETTYIKKYHRVSFSDVNAGRGIDIADDYVFNRGYGAGEVLNFGFNRSNGSHVYWQRGHLKIFLNGGTCNRTADITFGYNSYGRCYHRSKGSDCTLLGEEVRLKLDSLINGEFLAPYHSFRLPRRPSVPLLRNYNSTNLNNVNATECLLPVQQDIYVEFTTVYTSKGFPVHRAVGLMVNRTFANVSNLISVALTSQVIFVEVKSGEEKPLSRFWQKVYSPEYSENAWLNIFNIVDQPHGEGELQESIFWLFLPVVILSATLMLLRNNL